MASAFDHTDADFSAKVRAMIAESGGRITIVSGYRSTERQQQLWVQALNKYGSAQAARQWVAPPGHSNHERGIAFDLGGDVQLAHQLAPKYGLNFPMGHEPWHVEPAGARGSAAAHTIDPDAQAAAPVPGEPDAQSILGGTGDPMAKTFGALQKALGDIGTEAQGEAADPFSMPTGDSSAPMSGVTANPVAPAGGGEEVDKFMRALGVQESGGNYNSKNAGSGASGKYQIMPANWGAWSKEAGMAGAKIDDPAAQEAVTRFKLQQYYKQFGDWGKVAKAWYSGPGNVNKNVSGGSAYPDSNTYASQVLSKMGSD